ncbi:MAG: hypothetical protein IIB17_03285 [Chloroflexi bacterium]|nr:hypothetical protein [Chloroflexota bacterium]
MEKAGIPVAQVTPMTLVAETVGSNRIIRGRSIVHPLGDAELAPDEERELRRNLVQRALDALASDERTIA